MIKVEKLTKRYGSFEALKGVSFEVEEGSVFSLLGSNGAGKTTLIKIITGLLEKTSGNAYINGIQVGSGVDIKRCFGYMPEQPHIYDRLTGREFLEMMGSIRGVDKKALKDKIARFSEVMEIEGALDAEMGSYSKGMKQKVIFANSIIPDPPNLILDEPTTGLDPRFKKFMKDQIKNQAEKGKTVLMSTHITSVAEDIADVTAIINGGRIVAQGTPEQLMEEHGCKNLEGVFVDVVNDERKPA